MGDRRFEYYGNVRYLARTNAVAKHFIAMKDSSNFFDVQFFQFFTDLLLRMYSTEFETLTDLF
jgi:hypothetical protein